MDLSTLFRNVNKSTKRDVATVIKNLQRLSDGKDVEEVGVLYGAGNYSIAGPYKRFCIQSSEWHSWDKNRRKDHIPKFRSFVPGKTDLFSKPKNNKKKPCYQERPKRAETNVIIDRHKSNANSDKQQTPNQQEASLRFVDPRYSLLKHFIILSFAYWLTVSITRASYTKKIKVTDFSAGFE